MSNPKAPAEIKGKPRRRFYESVVFLHAVTQAWQLNRQAVVQSHDLMSANTSSTSSEAIFKGFVNSLGQFCDVKLGGDFVTAFTVLDREDRIQYRFACNRANRNQLKKTSAYVTDLLMTLRDGERAPDHLEQVLLEKVLAHCKVRMHTYLGAFKNACRGCIRTQPADRASLEQLQVFEKSSAYADFGSLEPDEFAKRCKSLMDLIGNCQQRSEHNVLAERPAHSNMVQSSNCWSDLRHYAGRLLSYSRGVRALVTATRNSPRLVDRFEVIPVPSSSPDDNPLCTGAATATANCEDPLLPVTNVTVVEMLRRMVPAHAQAAQYIALLAEIRSIDMDKTIQETIAEATFRPIVHAELLILQSLERDGLTHPSHFFNSWKYIGSSKATCRLCHWYFAHHDGGFDVRPTHGNLYINWKPPDVRQGDGQAAIKERERMLNTMNARIRAEALRTLRDKVPLGRLHDSSTGMTFATVPSLRANHHPNGVEVDMETSVDDQDYTAMD